MKQLVPVITGLFISLCFAYGIIGWSLWLEELNHWKTFRPQVWVQRHRLPPQALADTLGQDYRIEKTIGDALQPHDTACVDDATYLWWQTAKKDFVLYYLPTQKIASGSANGCTVQLQIPSEYWSSTASQSAIPTVELRRL